MNFEVQSPFEQLWSLLNFSPDEPFRSMGEVSEWLDVMRDNLVVCDRNVTGALIALTNCVDAVGSGHPDASMLFHNFKNFASLISEHGSFVRMCIERDILALEIFLDLPAGNDPSLN